MLPEVSSTLSVTCLRSSGLFVPLLVVILGGCGESGLPDMIPIRGTVIFNEAPLTEGTVLYLPKSPGGRQARGDIQPDGSFRLTTLRADDGAQIGEYDIVVIALKPHPGEPSREELEAAGGLIQRGYAIPEKYINRKTSGLSDSVNKDHSGTMKIVLEG